MSEERFRSKMLESLRREGVLCQRFEDMFAAGIPDTFIGTPEVGIWLEAKYRIMPKKEATPLNLDNLTQPQQNWLLLAWKRPMLSGVICGTDRGWVVIPAPRMKEQIFMKPASALTLTQGNVSMGQILEYFK